MNKGTNQPVKKEQCECPCHEAGADNCMMCDCRKPSPRPDGWEELMNEMRKFFFMCGVMRVEPILEDFVKLLQPVLLSTRQEDARRFLAICIDAMDNLSPNMNLTAIAGARRLLDKILTALSTWEENT